jgi:hypothetical protein
MYHREDYAKAAEVMKAGTAYRIFTNTGKKVSFDKDDQCLKKFDAKDLFLQGVDKAPQSQSPQ